MYGWGLLLFRKQKKGTAVVLMYLKWKNKARLGFYIMENAKITHG